MHNGMTFSPTMIVKSAVHTASDGHAWTMCMPNHDWLFLGAMQDSLPEWSKGVDSSSTSASCVGSNPTGVNPQAQRKAQHKLTAIDCAELSLPVLPTGAQFVVCGTLSTGDDRYLWTAACCLPCCCCRAHICRLVCVCACQRGPRRHVARQVATWQPSG